jgi:hypothetical protein
MARRYGGSAFDPLASGKLADQGSIFENSLVITQAGRSGGIEMTTTRIQATDNATVRRINLTTLAMPTSCAGCGHDLNSAALVIELASGQVGWCVLCQARAGD